MSNNAAEMDVNNANGTPMTAVSDQALRCIVEEGFFGGPGSLANARSACAELIFARAMIKAQTAKILQHDPIDVET